MRRRRGRPGAAVDLSVRVGSVRLAAPVMTASGTAGHGDELAAYFDLSRLGAVVVKSLGADPWPGNPAPRVQPTPAGMLNSVGLQGPGVTAWVDQELPALVAAGATVVASIWGRSVEDYRRAAEALAGCGDEVVAVEVNLSCPNLDGGSHLFAHDPEATAAVLSATEAVGRPRWAKLSPNTDRLVEIAGVAASAGRRGGHPGQHRDGHGDRRRDSGGPVLGGRGGGLSGPAIHPVAVRAVHDVHAAHPDLPDRGGRRRGHGGRRRGAAARRGRARCRSARRPSPIPAPRLQVLDELENGWCDAHGVDEVASLTGALR